MIYNQNIDYSKFLNYAVGISLYDGGIWFDSSRYNQDYSRYSFACCDPYVCFDQNCNIFDEIDYNIKNIEVNSDIPFCGGFAGFFSYDLGAKLLDVNTPENSLVKTPLFHGGMYDTVLYADHKKEEAGIISSNINYAQKIDFYKSLYKQDLPKYESNIEFDVITNNYQGIVEKIRNHIEDGDIFQANLARYYHSKNNKDFNPLEFYLKLREVNSAPFGFYMNGGGFNIMSSSPERFIKISDNNIETCPIKGTLSNDFSSKDLLNSQKDRAENIMIVDMLRNDLAKTAKTQSVKVTDLCKIESYEGIHHLVSKITAKKEDKFSNIDVLKNAFPGGSITGTPKKHAMEIISKYENIARGGYCGSAGYISFNGKMDMNILIRTVFCDNENISFGAGCGITYESNSDAEYEESILKAKKILEAFGNKI